MEITAQIMVKPTNLDYEDYLCFLAMVGRVPRRVMAKMFRCSVGSIYNKADRGEKWTDHFMTPAHYSMRKEIQNASSLTDHEERAHLNMFN